MKLGKRFERWGKRVIRRFVRLMLPKVTESGKLDPSTVHRILVVRQDARLGNVVMMIPMLASLRDGFPGARVTVLIADGFQDVLADSPFVDDIIVFDRRAMRHGFWRYPAFIRNLRRQAFDLAIDVSDGWHFSLTNVLVTAFSGARDRIGYDREESRGFLTRLAPRPQAGTYMPDALVGLVRDLVPVAASYPLVYPLADCDRRFAQEWLAEHDIRDLDSFAALHPGGKGKKRLSEGCFAELIDRIDAELGLRLVVIAGAAERGIVQELRRLAKAPFVVLEDVRVGQMAGVIERSDLFISGDTGPMHVAAALGRPTVAVFLSSDYRVYGPRGDRSRIVPGNADTLIEDVMLAIRDLAESHV